MSLQPIETGRDANAFAYHTMTSRFPANIDKVIDLNSFPKVVNTELLELREEVRSGAPLRSLRVDDETWREAVEDHKERGWLDMPWFMCETYFYRVLLDVTGYFDEAAATCGVDPYAPIKLQELETSHTYEVLAAAVEGARELDVAVLHYALWGNRVDLSYAKLAQASSGAALVVEDEAVNLVVDESQAFLGMVARERESSGAPLQCCYVADNSGLELLMDLVLIDCLLRTGTCSRVTLCVKGHPTYISDATVLDVVLHLDQIKAHADKDSPLWAMQQRLRMYINAGRVALVGHLFWNSHHMFSELSSEPEIWTLFSNSNFVVFKGDANYRRLVGDLDGIDPTTSLTDILAAYDFPTAALALRTLKSDPIVGLPAGKAEQLDKEDAEWRVNGKRGVVQFVPCRTAQSLG